MMMLVMKPVMMTPTMCRLNRNRPTLVRTPRRALANASVGAIGVHVVVARDSKVTPLPQAPNRPMAQSPHSRRVARVRMTTKHAVSPNATTNRMTPAMSMTTAEIVTRLTTAHQQVTPGRRILQHARAVADVADEGAGRGAHARAIVKPVNRTARPVAKAPPHRPRVTSREPRPR